MLAATDCPCVLPASAAGHSGNFAGSLRMYLLMDPGMRLLPQRQQDALIGGFWPLCIEFLAAVGAPPDEASYRAWLAGVKTVLDCYIQDRRGGLFTAVRCCDSGEALQSGQWVMQNVWCGGRVWADGGLTVGLAECTRRGR